MNKGFTVVEIVVVLGIMAVITGIVLFNVGSEKQNAALFRSAQNLSLNLRKAENNFGRNYKMDSGEELETVNLEAGVKIKSITNSTSDVVFIPPAPLVRFTSFYGGQNTNDTMDIVLINKNSSTRTITINKTGFISSP